MSASTRKRGTSVRLPIYLDLELCKDFLRWSQVERGNSDGWVEKQRAILAWWMGKLQGIDLRRATLVDHLLPPFQGTTSRAQRTEVLKTLYGWLRKVKHSISAQEDPTFGVLSVEAERPAQHTKSKVIPKEHYLLATGPPGSLQTPGSLGHRLCPPEVAGGRRACGSWSPGSDAPSS